MAIGAILNQVFPEPMLPQILVTPIVPFSSVTASNGLITYNGVYNGSVWVIDVDDFGDYDITAIKSDGSGTSEDTVSVTVNKQYEIELGAPTILSVLNDNSWEAIRYAADNNLGANYWAVGDAKQIIINGTIGTKSYSNYQPWVYILGFNHNASLEGNNTIHFGCFRSTQAYSVTSGIALTDDTYLDAPSSLAFNMNTSGTNSGGWEDSAMRINLLDADATSATSSSTNSFLAALPFELQSVLKQCTKYTNNVGESSSQNAITATQDWVWLLSEYEVQGAITYSNTYESIYQQRYQYYVNGNSKIKYMQSNTSTAAVWWNRSPYAIGSGFCFAAANGGASSQNAKYSYGLAPAFCV